MSIFFFGLSRHLEHLINISLGHKRKQRLTENDRQEKEFHEKLNTLECSMLLCFEKSSFVHVFLL